MWYPPNKQQIESNTNPFRALTPEQMRLKHQQEIAEQEMRKAEEEGKKNLDEKVKVPSKLIKDFQKEIKNERDYQFAGTDDKENKKQIIEDEKELLKVLKFLQKGQIEKAYDAFDALDTALADVVPQKLLKFMDQNLDENTIALLDEIVRAKDKYPEIDKIKKVMKKKGIGFYTEKGKIMVNPKNEMEAKEALNKAFGGDYEKKTGMQVKGDKKTSLSAETELDEGLGRNMRMIKSVKDKLTKAGIRSAIMFDEVHVAPDNVKEAEKIVGKMPFKVVPQKKLEEMSAKDHYRKVMRGGKGKGFVVSNPIDRERYPNREKEGLEGPYKSRKSGKIFYYDKKEGKYYDPDSDMFLDVSDVMESTELDEATFHTVFVTASRTAYRKLESLIASIDGYKGAEFDNGKASFVFDAKSHGGAARRKVGEFIKKVSGAKFSHAIAEDTELTEAWTADSVKKNADIGSDSGYGINIKKRGSITKTPYKHMLMLRTSAKKIKVRFDHGKDEFVGSPEQVADHLNRILGIKENPEYEKELSDMNIGEINEKVMRPMGLPGKFPPKGKFTKQQIDALRKEYAKIGSVDPSSKTYGNLTDFLDSLSDDMIKQLSTAKIKFISGLALNRAMKRGLKDSYEFDSKTGEYIRADGEDPLGIDGGLQRQVKESVELDEAADEVAARELTLYIENDASLYRQRVQPIIKNLARKMKKGTFDAELAVKGFMYAVEHGLKNYKKDFGPGFKIDKDTKKKVAQDLLDNFMDEIEDAAK